MKLSETQQELASEATSRAEKIAAWYAKRYPAHEADICSAAQWGVVCAAASYTPDLDRVWAQWAKTSVEREIRRYLRRVDLARITPGLSEDQVVAPSAREDRLDETLELLPDPRRSLCRLIYGSGMNPGEAATQLGYSPRWGYWSHSEALQQLKAHFNEESPTLPPSSDG